MKFGQKLARPAGLVLAVLVAILTFAVVANAIQALVVPNASLVSFNLAPGAIAAPLTVPVVDQPVFLMGTTTTVGVRGVGQVSLLRTAVAPLFLQWVGLNSTANATIAQGFSPVPGTLIVFIDFAHQVRVEVHSATQIRVRNAAAAQRAGFVKMIW